MPLSHKHFTELMIGLKMGDPGGNCAGITEMGISEFLSEDFERFCTRLDRLEKITPSELSKKKDVLFGKFFSKDHKSIPLSTDEIKELSDILAFYEGVELYQRPDQHIDLLNQFINQYNIDQIAPLVQTKALEKKGGRVEIATLSGVYNTVELSTWFSSLDKAIRENPPPVDFALRLSTDEHTIGLGYCGETKQWSLIDANQLSRVRETIKPQDLHAEIFSAFCNIKSTGFITKVITTGNQKHHVDNIVKTWSKQIENLQSIKENAKKTTDRHWTLAHMAMRLNDHKTLQQILKSEPDLIKRDDLAFLAAQNGQTTALSLLIENKINLNQPQTKDIATPIFIACQNNHIEAVRLLAEHKANLNLPRKDSCSPLYMAIYKQNKNVVSILAKNKADLDQKTNGVPPICLAARKDDPKIIELLIKYKVNLNQADKNNDTPAYIAACKGNVKILYLLAENGVDLENQPRNLIPHIKFHPNPANFLKDLSHKLNKTIPDRMKVAKQLNDYAMKYPEKKLEHYTRYKTELDKLDRYTNFMYASEKQLNKYNPQGFKQINIIIHKEYKKLNLALSHHSASKYDCQKSLFTAINQSLAKNKGSSQKFIDSLNQVFQIDEPTQTFKRRWQL